VAQSPKVLVCAVRKLERKRERHVERKIFILNLDMGSSGLKE
tara:strand:- start:507 stop:632 length:126 start_codon:yes stop_codon:yes gene_type:complete